MRLIGSEKFGFGRDARLGRFENPLPFFGFPTVQSRVTCSFNPLVAGSNPARPTTCTRCIPGTWVTLSYRRDARRLRTLPFKPIGSVSAGPLCFWGSDRRPGGRYRRAGSVLGLGRVGVGGRGRCCVDVRGTTGTSRPRSLAHVRAVHRNQQSQSSHRSIHAGGKRRTLSTNQPAGHIVKP